MITDRPIIQGSQLVGTSYKPLFSSIPVYPSGLKIIPASHVTSDSGTGLVHCAPAHGFEDYNTFRALGLLDIDEMLCHVDGAGKFTKDVASVVGTDAGKALVGQEVLKGGSVAIIELLKSTGCLIKVEKLKHRFPYDWRTNEPIIVT